MVFPSADQLGLNRCAGCVVSRRSPLPSPFTTVEVRLVVVAHGVSRGLGAHFFWISGQTQSHAHQATRPDRDRSTESASRCAARSRRRSSRRSRSCRRVGSRTRASARRATSSDGCRSPAAGSGSPARCRRRSSRRSRSCRRVGSRTRASVRRATTQVSARRPAWTCRRSDSRRRSPRPSAGVTRSPPTRITAATATRPPRRRRRPCRRSGRATCLRSIASSEWRRVIRRRPRVWPSCKRRQTSARAASSAIGSSTTSCRSSVDSSTLRLLSGHDRDVALAAFGSLAEALAQDVTSAMDT